MNKTELDRAHRYQRRYFQGQVAARALESTIEAVKKTCASAHGFAGGFGTLLVVGKRAARTVVIPVRAPPSRSVLQSTEVSSGARIERCALN